MNGRAVQVAHEIAKWKEELEYLNSFSFDKDIFLLKRNYIFGAAIVDELRSKMKADKLIWERGYSKEDRPQHWLYYCMEGLEKKYKTLYNDTINKFPILADWKEMLNTGLNYRKPVDISTELLFNIIVSIYDQVITTVEGRMRPNQAIGLMVNDLKIAHRQKEIIAQTMLDAAKKEATALLNDKDQ